MVGGGSSIAGGSTGSDDPWIEDDSTSSSEELIETAAIRAGADLRREVSVVAVALTLDAGRGGLNAGALRFCGGFEAAGMSEG